MGVVKSLLKELNFEGEERGVVGIVKDLILLVVSHGCCDGSIKGRKWVLEWRGVHSGHSKGP